MQIIYNNKRTEIMKVDEKISKLLTAHDINLNSPINKQSQNIFIGKSASNSKLKRVTSNEVDRQCEEHDRFLTNIGKNLGRTSDNMYDLNIELKEQGNVLNNIAQKAIDANHGIELADEKISSMEYRNMCYAIILHILVILLFIAIIIVLIVKLYIKKI